jgi:hypothetical protein
LQPDEIQPRGSGGAVQPGRGGGSAATKALGGDDEEETEEEEEEEEEDPEEYAAVDEGGFRQAVQLAKAYVGEVYSCNSARWTLSSGEVG